MADETPPGELSEEQRRQAFREELGMLPSGPRVPRAKIPPRFVMGVAAAFVVLGLGGAVLEHFFGGGGTPPTTAATTAPNTTIAGSTSSALAWRAYIGLKEIGNITAPAIRLTAQSGQSWSLQDDRGHVVLLAFYSQNCRDICPVLGVELREALSLLAAQGVGADIAIVNTDPFDLTSSAAPAALRIPQLGDRANVVFLNGSLSQLTATWTNYGVTVRVGSTPDEITHNNLIYFISPRGRLSALAVPFAHQVSSREVTLSATMVARFARGVAAEADSLSR